jgi:putative NADH-flavin reductase
MKLFVLGATGGTGRAMVASASQRGHAVTAFGRSQAPAPAASVQGDVNDEKALAQAMAGHDAVLFTLGPRTLEPTTLYSTSMRATLAAMRAAQVKRLVAISRAILFPGAGGPPGAVMRWVLRHGNVDCAEMERLIVESDREWTIVRPPGLTNGRGRGRWRLAVNAMPSFGVFIARADIGTLSVELAEKGEHIRELLGVAR